MASLYKFDNLRKYFEGLGILIENHGEYIPLETDFTLSFDSDQSLIFDNDFIVLLDNDHKKHFGYYYEWKYNISRYGNPRIHVCKCEGIKHFIEKNNFDKYYKFTNESIDTKHDIKDRITGKVHKGCKLNLCKFCIKILKEKWGKRLHEDNLKKMLGKFVKKSNCKHDLSPMRDLFGYNIDWNLISRRIREKRKYTCYKCDFKAESIRERQYIEVHHINGDKQDNSDENLLVLCTECHSKIDERHMVNFSKGNKPNKIKRLKKIKELRNII